MVIANAFVLAERTEFTQKEILQTDRRERWYLLSREFKDLKSTTQSG